MRRPTSSTCAATKISAFTGTAFFDLDRTLLDCNSARLWVQEEWRNGAIGLRDVTWAAWWLGRYSLGLEAGLEAVLETAVARLEGQSEEEMRVKVNRWFARDVVHRLRPGAALALEWHRARGDRLVLATSSSPYVGAAACGAFGLHDLICTRFQVVAGIFTGAVSEMALGPAKAERAREWAMEARVDLSTCVFYTDSHPDLALMYEVGTPIAVNPDRRLRNKAIEQSWSIQNWGSPRRLKFVVGK